MSLCLTGLSSLLGAFGEEEFAVSFRSRELDLSTTNWPMEDSNTDSLKAASKIACPSCFVRLYMSSLT